MPAVNLAVGASSRYLPIDRRTFAVLLRAFRRAHSHDVLRAAALAFAGDPSVPGPDLLAALGRVERRRGWR